MLKRPAAADVALRRPAGRAADAEAGDVTAGWALAPLVVDDAMRWARKRLAQMAEEAAADAAAGDCSRRLLVRSGTMEAELRETPADIGTGARAAVIFHTDDFTSAVVALDPVPPDRDVVEATETNHNSREVLFSVVQAEPGQVEFVLGGFVERLGAGAEVMVPPGAAYAIRNFSRTTGARLLLVMPDP